MDPFLNELLEKTNNEFQTSTKSEEEIKRLTLDENMPETKRTIYILNRGQPIQKFAVYLNLHHIMLEPDAFEKVLPLVAGEILNQSEEIQIQAAKSLIKVIQHKTISRSHLTQIFQIVCSMLKIWNQVVLDEWVCVFNELLKKIPYEAISRECESTILSLSEASQHSLSKYVAVRMIGFVAENGIKNATQLFNRARILCQDPDFEIRKALAEEVMYKICFNVGTELTESKFIEKILELHYDSNMSIKLAAISSLVKVVEILSYDFRKNRMVTVFLELMNSVNEEVMKKMSFYIGEIVHKLGEVLQPNSSAMNQIQNIYRDWSTSRNPEIKKNIIYNMPYMLTFYENKDHFLAFYIKALKDTNVNNKHIKMTAVSCFHEICKIFKGEDFPSTLRDMFEALMKETGMEIVEKLISHLDDFIQVFHVKRDENEEENNENNREEEKERKDMKSRDNQKSTKDLYKEDQVYSYLEDMLKLAELAKTNCNWRLEVTFMTHINKYFEYFDLKDLAHKYANYLLDRIAKGVKQVQEIAINHLVYFLKRNYIPKRTAEILYALVHSLSAGSNYNQRMVYLELYEKLADNFSKKFFKLHGLNEPVIKLGDDKVPEIKKKFLEKSIVIRRMIHQTENPFISKLEDYASKNRTDKNVRVANAAKEAFKELKSLTQYYFAECEEEDKKKMAEEDILAQKEQKEIEESKRRQSDDIRRDKGDSLMPYSALMTAAKKGSKPPGNFKQTGKPTSFSPNPTSATMTPKTKILGAQLYSNGISILKNPSNPGSTTHTDELESKGKDHLSKFAKPSTGTKIGGLAPPIGFKKVDSPGTIGSASKISSVHGGLGSSMNPLSKSALVASKISSDNSKMPSIKSNVLPDLNKAPKDFVKVPKIKKKI